MWWAADRCHRIGVGIFRLGFRTEQLSQSRKQALQGGRWFCLLHTLLQPGLKLLKLKIERGPEGPLFHGIPSFPRTLPFADALCKQRIHKFLGVEGQQVASFFADADEAYR